MTSPALVSNDRRIQQDVRDELGWTPEVDAVGIGVAVEGGTVTLSGEVDDFAERHAADRAARRTIGVTTVVDDLVIRPSSYVWTITDATIARNVDEAVHGRATPSDPIRTRVEDHVVTLSGEVQWSYQRENAARAVERVTGVARVVNGITLHARASAADTDARIRQALARNATIDADTVEVHVDGTPSRSPAASARSRSGGRPSTRPGHRRT